MNTLNDLQSILTSEHANGKRRWTAGRIIKSYEGKGFNRSGDNMTIRDMKTYIFEIFPPEELAIRMQQPSADIVKHLQQEGIDTRGLSERSVSFMAHVSVPYSPENSAVDIILTSTQRQNGGVYRQHIKIPRPMLCVRESPVDTVLDTLNNALHQHHWYPPY